MSWDIIVWEAENAIDYVPACWGNAEQNAYKYPIKLSEQKIRALIYEASDLKTNYKVCPARCLKRDIRDIKKAQQLCEKGRYTSNIESDELSLENEPDTGKRLSKRPRKLLEFEENDSPQETENSSDESSDIPNRRRKIFSVPLGSSRLNFAESPSIISAAKLPAVVSVSSPLSSSTSRASSASLNSRETREIFALLTDIKFEIKEVKKKLNENHNANCYNNIHHSQETAEFSLITSLPCNSLQDINEMEENLNNPSMMKQLVRILYLVGGDSLQKTIYLIMAKLMGREIALQYSGQGKKKKLPFCNLKNMFKAVIDATRRRHENASDDEIKKIVSLYLATSKARLPPSKRNSSDDSQEAN